MTLSRLKKVSAAAAALVCLAGASGTALGQAGQAQVTDIAPSAVMLKACFSGSVGQCDAASLVAVDTAHRLEGLPPLHLPTGFRRLSMVGQLVAVTNAERASRGLAPLRGPDRAMDALAGNGAAVLQDPAGPQGRTWASNLASGLRTPLEADFQWMYNDGPGGTNVECTTATSPGCWAHRHNILSPWRGSIGAAARSQHGHGTRVFTELMVAKA